MNQKRWTWKTYPKKPLEIISNGTETKNATQKSKEMRPTRTCTETIIKIIISICRQFRISQNLGFQPKIFGQAFYLPRFWLVATVVVFAHETNTTKKHPNRTKNHLNEKTPKKKLNIAKSSFSNTAQWIYITGYPAYFFSKITFRIPEFIFEVDTFWGFYGFI